MYRGYAHAEPSTFSTECQNLTAKQTLHSFGFSCHAAAMLRHNSHSAYEVKAKKAQDALAHMPL